MATQGAPASGQPTEWSDSRLDVRTDVQRRSQLLRRRDKRQSPMAHEHAISLPFRMRLRCIATLCLGKTDVMKLLGYPVVDKPLGCSYCNPDMMRRSA